MSNLSSQLRDRRWQKRRLEILQRDNFTCTYCGSTDNAVQLHVHHRAYLPQTNMWAYPDRYLVTLCADCHERATEQARANAAAWAEITVDFCREESIGEFLAKLIEIRDCRPNWDILKHQIGAYPPEASELSIEDVGFLQIYLRGIC